MWIGVTRRSSVNDLSIIKKQQSPALSWYIAAVFIDMRMRGVMKNLLASIVTEMFAEHAGSELRKAVLELHVFYTRVRVPLGLWISWSYEKDSVHRYF